MAGTGNTGGANGRPQYSWIAGIRRLTRYRLVIPIKRSIHSPVHTARGVMVGIAWAMTPTIGLQMPLVFVTWLITRRLFRWDFNVVIGMVWTWATNVVTMVPAYYGFYVTGQFMLGRSDAGKTGYGEFRQLMDRTLVEGADVGWFEWTTNAFSAIIHGWGVPMAVGCIPWAIAAGWVSYVWTLKFVHKYRAVRAHRRQTRLAAAAPPPGPPEGGNPA
jgi:uncharacterized protein (DUF2062 family)